ncbi:ATP-binding protein [Draconibacterium halophilum]|uniref:histidine kinase n=1 Tax=Draconibacterium halophilum TaxID=2706887 RepID=A0A6C0RDN3_9BACT|nr:sensor histidine kinase [Draconibacterium halophilum]QIA08167.1 tetratricopeptide repeat protein [Draconibacterium halophilum]
MKNSTFIFLFLYITHVIAQPNEIDSLLLLLDSEQNKYEAATINLQLAKLHERIDFEKGKRFAKNALITDSDSLMAEASNQLGRLYFYTAQLDSAELYFERAKKYLTKIHDEKRVAIINIGIGAIQLRQGDYNKTIRTLTESVSYFEKTGDDLNTAKCYSNMSAAFAELGDYTSAIEYNEKALQIFKQQKLKQFQVITLPNLAAQHLKNGDTLKAINYGLDAEKLALSMGNKRSLSIIYNNLGSAYLDIDEEKAKDYLQKTIALKKELNLKNGTEIALGNLGYLYLKKKDYKTALEYYKLVEPQVNGKQLVFTYNQLQKCYNGLRQYQTALYYSEKSRILNDSILNSENQKVFTEIKTKYETEKKEKEILELQSKNLEVDNKRIQNQNLLFASLVILLLTYLLVYFFTKRARQKQKIAQNKLLNKLKNQELNGIDAIIEAQEKERSRIADDLHDNLGSRIATIKMYINELDTSPEKEKTELIEKLKTISEKTYGEVRKIAHNKYSGTLISQGLIPAMVVIANQLSSTKQLNIKVVNINVKQRIKNSIEIQVFRIIQELLTNIIKHAKASEAIIQFSEDDNILNVMIEDNGKGFETKQTNFGFGLTNIEKRIDILNGNLVIDSSEHNGTTVILTIPL